MPSLPICPQWTRKNISAICECFLKYALRRYCLVEKSKAITAYKAMSDYGKEKGVECAQCANYAARVWMKRLFPDLTCNSDPEPVEITIKRKKK